MAVENKGIKNILTSNTKVSLGAALFVAVTVGAQAIVMERRITSVDNRTAESFRKATHIEQILHNNTKVLTELRVAVGRIDTRSGSDVRMLQQQVVEMRRRLERLENK